VPRVLRRKVGPHQREPLAQGGLRGEVELLRDLLAAAGAAAAAAAAVRGRGTADGAATQLRVDRLRRSLLPENAARDAPTLRKLNQKHTR
jgi:hypothetical protein